MNTETDDLEVLPVVTVDPIEHSEAHSETGIHTQTQSKPQQCNVSLTLENVQQAELYKVLNDEPEVMQPVVQEHGQPMLHA